MQFYFLKVDMAPKAIFAASRYAGALDAYIDYIKNMERRGSRVGQGDPREPLIPLFVHAFGLPLPLTIWVKASGTKPAWDASFKTKLAPYTKDVAPTGNDTEIELDSYSPPRVNLITGLNARGTVKSSNVTKLKYLDYGGKARSAPFGRKVATDTIGGVFEELKVGLGGLAGGGSQGGQATRVYLIPEKL